MPFIRRIVVALSVSAVMWSASAGVAAASSKLASLTPSLNTVTTTMPTGSPVARVNVQNDNGAVVFRAGSPGTVTRTEAWNFVEPSYSQSLSDDGTLTIRARCPSDVPDNDCSVSLVITVPPTVAIRASTINGNVEVAGFQSPTVAATSTNGNVNISLDVPPAGFPSPTVAAKSTNGDVNVSLESVPTKLLMSTINGRIHSTVPAGAYALSTATVNGQVTTVTGIEDDPDPAASVALSADTINGDITLRGV